MRQKRRYPDLQLKTINPYSNTIYLQTTPMKISSLLANYLQTVEQLRISEKDRANAEKEVNRAIAGSKKDDVYTAIDADHVLTLIEKVRDLEKRITQLNKDYDQAILQIREYLQILGGSVDFTDPAGSIINFSLNEYHEVILHPN